MREQVVGEAFVSGVFVETLLHMKPEDRVAVIGAVMHNDFFCPHCGYGDRKNPNPRCQCENDE